MRSLNTLVMRFLTVPGTHLPLPRRTRDVRSQGSLVSPPKLPPSQSHPFWQTHSGLRIVSFLSSSSSSNSSSARYPSSMTCARSSFVIPPASSSSSLVVLARLSSNIALMRIIIFGRVTKETDEGRLGT